MNIAFFITDSEELYCSIEDTSPVTAELFQWLSENRLEMGRKASFEIREESPIFSSIEEAEEWLEKFFDKDKSHDAGIKDSIDAMIYEAKQQGWFRGKTLSIIPELLKIYKGAADHFMKMIEAEDTQYRETLMYHTCRYLFAKAVEGVILWGNSPDGKISVYFSPKHIFNDFETEVPQHLHQTVIDSMPVGESLFKAHQKFVIQAQTSGLDINLREEMQNTIYWITRLGMSYALFNRFGLLR